MKWTFSPNGKGFQFDRVCVRSAKSVLIPIVQSAENTQGLVSVEKLIIL